MEVVTIHNTKKNEIDLKRYKKRELTRLKQYSNGNKKSYKKPKSTKIKFMLDFLIEQQFDQKIKLTKNKKSLLHNRVDTNKEFEIKIPEVFSFAENPDDTILVFKQLASFPKRNGVPILTIDFRKCKKMSLCASTVLSAIILEIEVFVEKRKNSNFLINASNVEGNSDFDKMLRISGLVNHLKFPKSDNDAELEKEFLTLPLISNSNCNGNPVEKISSYYAECLNLQGVSLNEEGDQLLGDIIGEVFQNIDEHNKLFKSWYAIGHCEKQVRENCSEVQLTIFNFGVSFFESFKQEDTEEFSSDFVKKMYEKNIVNKKLNISEELYVTILALQGGISRVKKSEQSDRGQGMIDLIQSFEALGQTSEKDIRSLMSITTGNVNIKFNPMWNRSNGRTIFLNQDFSYPEDINPDAIKINKYAFPGTVISMRFFVDKKYLEETLSNN